MPLESLENSDLFSSVKDKVNLAIDEINDLTAAASSVDTDYMEINSPRITAGGSPFFTTASQLIFTFTTPNDGVTRNYNINLTSVIHANGVTVLGYNTVLKLGGTTKSTRVCSIESGTRTVYGHNAVIEDVPPNSTINIYDFKTAATDGTVDESKLTYMGFAV